MELWGLFFSLVKRQTTGDEGGKGQKKQRDNKEAATRRKSLTQPISRPCSLRVDIMGATFPEQGSVKTMRIPSIASIFENKE